MRGVQVIAEQRILSAWKNVLGADAISPDDNFFEVGGDSVAALRVVNLLAAEGLSISLRDFYLAATPAGQAGRATAAAPPAPEADEADEDDTARLPLTPLQSVMVVEALRRPEGEAHWLTLAYALPAGTGPEEALAAWRETLRANPALRTRIALDGTGPHQTIGADGPELRIENAGGLDGQELRAWSRDRAAELRGRILSEPLRAYFLTGEPGDDPVLVLVCHHALMDGWSMEQCVGDFHRALAAPGERLPRRPSGAGYQAWLEATGAEAACAAYWRRRMRGAEPAAPLPFERGNGGNAGRGEERAPDPREWHKRLSGAAALGLEDFARAHGLTRAGVLTALWAHLLRQYQDGDDVHVGLTVNNRPAAELPGVAEASGFLLNTLPLRLTPSEDFVADCRRVMAGSAEVAANAHLPYAAVVEAAGLPGMTRLFNTTLIFQNYRRGEEIAGAAQVRQLYAHGTSIDELSLTVDLDEADVRICAAWDAALYDRAAVEALVRDLDYWLAHLDALDPAGIQRGLKTPQDPSHALAGTAADPRPWSVAELLAAGTADGSTDAKADATAVVHGETRLSYARLRERAAALAARLAGEHGVGPGDRVALLGDRGAEAAVALCAVWLLGASWCPVSPAWPAERREATLRVLRPAAVVDLATIDLATEDETPELPAYAMPPESVAYHVPTSGSSGAPKLVAVPAGGLGPLVDAWLERYALAGTPQRVLQFGSWTSDVFLGDLLKALATGGTLVICPDDARVDLEKVERLLRRWDITLLESTPVMVTAVVRHLARRPGTTTPPPPPALRTLIAGSDTFRLREAEEATALLWDGVRLYNGYGLSECTIESLVQRCQSGMAGMASGSGLVPVGRPLPGTRVDVVDRAGRSLPYGAMGELVIAGPQVALGYLTEDGLTGGGRFTEGGDGVRHFRTGDLVRYGPDGRLEFHGRRDGLVKVRGHRVEVGEVEDRLLRLPGVAESFVCLARRDVQDELVAFVGGSGGGRGLEERALRDGLRRLLPDHAVPGRVIVERRLPRTGNGKLDRVLMRRRAEETPAAPPPDPRPAASATAGDELTARLVAVWSEVLERPVNPDRSFFDQGGNSILAMRLYARLKELLPAHDFPIGQLFAHPTITAFRASLREPRREEQKGRPTDELALLRALERGELNTAGAMRLLRAGATRRSGGSQ